MSKEQAIKEFLEAIEDPAGPVYKAAYRSFRKGQEAQAVCAFNIATKYGIDSQVLVDAELHKRAEILCGARRIWS